MNSSAPSIPAERGARRVAAGRHSRRSAAGFGIVVDGAVGYALRLIPSNKDLGRFATTHDAWLAVIAAVEEGRLSRMLVLDWYDADSGRGKVASGATLEYLARTGLGLPAEHLRSADQGLRSLDRSSSTSNR